MALCVDRRRPVTYSPAVSQPLSQRRRTLLLLATLGALALVVTTAAVLVKQRHDRRAREFLTLNADDKDLREVMEEIRKHVGIDIIVEPDVDAKVTIATHDTWWRDVLDAAARQAECEVEERHGTLVVTRNPKITFCDPDNCTVEDAIAQIATYCGKPVVFEGAFKTRCPPLDITNVNWWKAVEAICKESGLHARREDGVVYVSSAP
jgi:type II secretory pathway component GspD/PulD (secretin)